MLELSKLLTGGLMAKLFLCKLYIRKLLMLLLIVGILMMMLSKLLAPLYVNRHYQNISKDLVYSQVGNINEYEQYAKDNNLAYSLSPAVSGSKLEPQVLESTESIYLYDLNYLDETSPALIEDMMKRLNVDNEKYIDLNKIIYSSFPNEVDQYSVWNESLNVEQVLEGSYPHSVDELMIPEVYAIKTANELNLSTYQELIGKEVTLDKEAYKVSGVYVGGDNFIGYSNLREDEAEAIFINVDNSQKKKLFNIYDDNDFVQHKDFRINNIIMKLPIMFKGLFFILASMFILVEQKQYVQVLNHYYYRRSNTIVPLFVPLVLIGIVIYVL